MADILVVVPLQVVQSGGTAASCRCRRHRWSEHPFRSPRYADLGEVSAGGGSGTQDLGTHATPGCRSCRGGPWESPEL